MPKVTQLVRGSGIRKGRVSGGARGAAWVLG